MAGLTIDELELGMTAELTRTYDEWDIYTFAALTGDLNPAHVDDAFAQQTVFKGRIAHGMLTASLISAVVGTKLPGVGSIYLNQGLKFLRPVRVGDRVTARVTVIEITREKNLVTLQTTCASEKGERLLEGTALVRPPRRKQEGVETGPMTQKGARSSASAPPRPTALRPRKQGLLVGQRMTPNPITISPDAMLSEARALLDQHGIRHLPVVSGEGLVGVLTESDIRQASLPAAAGSQGPLTGTLLALLQVRDVMTRDPVIIGPTAGIGEASSVLVSRKIGGLPVVEDGRLVGILTVIDALEALVELVGGSPGGIAKRHTTGGWSG